MKVLLKKDVPGLGHVDEVHDVADGYGRNYLIPQGLAVKASEGRVKMAKERAASQEAHEERMREHAEALAEKLKDVTLDFTVKAGETGRLYGSITSSDIADAIERVVDIEVDRRNLLLERPIREVGEHTVELKLQGGVRAEVHVNVEAEA